MTTNNFPAHLYTLAELSKSQIQTLLATANDFINTKAHLTKQHDLLHQTTLMTAFFSSSTRTKLGFGLAGLRLGAEVVHFEANHSSLTKGETALDTIQTLAAMGCDAMVIRSEEIELFETTVKILGDKITFINGGNGNRAHPGQGLIDALTIQRNKPDLANARVVIVGDIKHSRVVPSNIDALKALGVGQITLVGPEELLPEVNPWPEVDIHTDFDAALADTDVVMMLRIQHERMQQQCRLPAAEYFQQFGLQAERLRLAKPDAIVLHPGPINRGVEISDDVADGPQSRILQQVEYGIALRMAVLAHFIKRV